ncbi:MAG: phosphate ABC transporter substrate-binding protein [Rhodopirellula sp.]|nr:phosphate ABC transporter substrate-binding protein [Rhodopirellula sp.]
MIARFVVSLRIWIGILLAAGGVGCLSQEDLPLGGERTVVRVEGSDTLVNAAQAWAEQYHHEQPAVSVQVLGGGSGVGIASLIDGNCDIANASREMKPDEAERAAATRGAAPVETIVALDALAVLVHKDNPLDWISVDQLAEIFGEDGSFTRWSQLGVKGLPERYDKIIRVGRQNSSGTYAFFREIVLGKKRDYKLGSIDAHGSKDGVLLIEKTPGAIGYSGMGYITEGVKPLKISVRRGEAAIAPTLQNARDATYPLTRSLQLYTIGEPDGAVARYMQWILSPKGQSIVRDQGYVPVSDYE